MSASEVMGHRLCPIGMPLDLLVYETDSLRVSHFVSVTEEDPYFNMLRASWGERIRQAFHDLPAPDWSTMEKERSKPVFERHIRTVDH